ncbi:hypothetical protein BSKO_01937 [Bryopsis sp. KO-2023]|nr:hypothetical protein BSKO_01937 [Bryopsis sp. KO-2023]
MLPSMLTRGMRNAGRRVQSSGLGLSGARDGLPTKPSAEIPARYSSPAALMQPVNEKTVDVEEKEVGQELIGLLSWVEDLKRRPEQPNGAVPCSLGETVHANGESDRVRSSVSLEDQPSVSGKEYRFPRKYMERQYEKQVELEQRSLYDALEKYKKEVKSAKSRDMVAALPRAKRLLLRWFEPLVAAIKNEQQRVGEEWTYDLDWAFWRSPPERAGGGLNGGEKPEISHSVDKQSREKVAPYFVLLEPEEMAVICMHISLGMLVKGDKGEGGKAKVVAVATKVGKAIEDQVQLLRLKSEAQKRNSRIRKIKKAMSSDAPEGLALSLVEEIELDREMQPWEKKMAKDALVLGKKLRTHRNKWAQKGITQKDVQYAARRSASDVAPWGAGIQAQLGAKLLELLIQVAKVDISKRSVPAICHELVWKRGKMRPMCEGVLTIHPAVIRAIEDCGMHTTIALERALPMVYPPKEWRAHRTGGYLSLISNVMRVRGNEEQMELLRVADGNGSMKSIYKALNVLGNTPWKINKEVLDIVSQVWEQGGGVLDLPSRQDVPIPEIGQNRYRLSNRRGALYATCAGESFVEMLVRKEATRKAKKKNRELFSLRSDFTLKLGVAEKFKEEERFYFPHNVDFRGRAYPIPPHLNHLGSDVSRGMLKFADPRPLGPHGLNWLYIQIANLYGGGADKLPEAERKQFGQEHLEQILDSANSPLDGFRWWMNADEPWQLLATCKEIRDALNSDDPENFPSCMHVHQDGSCNGLQHYAALGRDSKGGMAVNLLPAEAPQDVYTGIAKIVAAKVDREAEMGHDVALKLMGHVDRKLVKQTVMTSVYGVTFIGAREQIANRLRERGWDDDNTVYKVSAYAAKVTLAGLHDMFSNAKDIMLWLADCAQLIAATGKTVVWKTPLGLPVMQPYRRQDTLTVRTVLQQLNLSNQDAGSPVMKQRQRSAFPPNYVHSLDSSHMMMTAIGCHESGLAFAGVHDSFWTHAGSVDEMNVILRENFFRLHSKPLLEELRNNFIKLYPEVSKFPEVPELGDLDLSTIHDSVYFFS